MPKIIMHIADYYGCAFYRIHQPAKYLKEHFEIEVSDTIRLSERADCIVLQRQHDNSILQANELRKTCKLIYENDDDLFNMEKDNSASIIYLPKRQIMIDYVNMCHGLTVSTQPLAELYGKLTNIKSIAVLPNAIDFELIRERKKNKSIILGFAGSVSHWKDLYNIMPAIVNILRKNKNVIFHSIGFDGMTRQMGNIYRDLPFGQYKQTGWTNAGEELYDAIDFDIGLIPCEDIVFNKSKSNVKYLEYSAKGVASIASNIYPYATTIEPEAGFLTKTRGAIIWDWQSKIQRLIDDTQLRLSFQNNAYNFVKQNFDIKNVVNQYVKYYKTIIKN